MSVAAIGECMVELSPRPGGLFGLGFGGDTLNTAVYLARLGTRVDYITALGDDGFSDRMIATWKQEGVGTTRVLRIAGALPGLYLIETDDKGERRFHYWRSAAPARQLFRLADAPAILEALACYAWIYVSGITLSLYDEAGRTALFGGLDRARRAGAKVAFDSNYRPRGWNGPESARAVFAEMLGRVDLALPTLDDERALWGDADAETCVRRLRAVGVAEVAVKDGPHAALVAAGQGAAVRVRAERVAAVVDTTAAGDAFNAGYLAARLAEHAPQAAAAAAHRLAAAVIGHHGAIIPKAAMPGGRG